MASNTLIIPPLPPDFDTNPKAQNQYLRALVFQLIMDMNQIQTQFDQIQGLRGNTTTFSGGIDLKNSRLMNVGKPKHEGDSTNIEDLQQKCFYFEPSSGTHKAIGPVDAPYGVRIPVAKDNNEAVQLGQLRSALGAVGIKI